MWVAAGICWNYAFLSVSARAATGRDEEEEGDAHRPGDHELRESVSTFEQGWIRSCTERSPNLQPDPRTCVFLNRFVDVLKLLHIVGVLFIQQLLLRVKSLCVFLPLRRGVCFERRSRDGFTLMTPWLALCLI